MTRLTRTARAARRAGRGGRLTPLFALIFGLSAAFWLPSSASANPSKVMEILRDAGSSGVVRGPGTIDNQTKKKAESIARSLAGKTGGRVYVVILNGKTSPGPYANLYGKLGMAGKDVLIATNGSKWELRADGISRQDKQRLLSSVMKRGGDPLARLGRLAQGIPGALRGSQRQGQGGKASRSSGQDRRRAASAAAAGGALTTTAPAAASSGSGWGTIVFFLLLLVGGVGFVLWRRKQRDGSLTADFKAALDPAENSMADFYLGTDGFESNPNFEPMLGRATALSNQIDQLKAKPPTRASIASAKALAKQAAELESELRRLR